MYAPSRLALAFTACCAASCSAEPSPLAGAATSAVAAPFDGLSPVDGHPSLYEARSRFGDGDARFLVWVALGQTGRVESGRPLIVDLHGGGRETDREASRGIAAKGLDQHVPSALAGEFIWIAPILRRAGHRHAWVLRDNALDVIDSIREVSARFESDDRRVYLTGASMGAGGAAVPGRLDRDAR